MMRTVAILMAIFLAVTAGVHLGYKYLEQELRQASCVPVASEKNGGTLKGTEVEQQQISGALPVAPIQDFQIIVRRDIFQVGTTAQAVVEKTPEPVQEVVPTSLNLTLAGTMLGSKDSARAIVVDNAAGNRKQLLLRVGDGVQGAVVKTIEWNKITLDVNGALEVLEMPKPGEKSPSRSARGNVFSPPPTLNRVEENANTLDRRRSPPRPRRRISLPELKMDDTSDVPPELNIEPTENELPSELNIEPTEDEVPPELNANESPPSADELLPPIE